MFRRPSLTTSFYVTKTCGIRSTELWLYFIQKNALLSDIGSVERIRDTARSRVPTSTAHVDIVTFDNTYIGHGHKY